VSSTGEPRRGPFFTGLVVYRNLEHGYSLLYPEGWVQLELESDAGQGVILAPTPDGVATSFSVESRDLGTAVAAEDLPTLRRGFLAGLRKLPGSAVEHQEDYAIGALVGLEARHAFRDGRVRRRRWVRLLYQGTIQVRLIAQGATVEEFDYWLPAFTSMMRTFRFGDWWADMTGRSWLPSLLPSLREAAEPDDEDPTGEPSPSDATR
jgi:hypothetical protein